MTSEQDGLDLGGVAEREAEEADEQWAHEEAHGTPPEVDYGRVKKWVIQRDGKDYVQYAGLLDLLHQVSGGEFTITTRLEQAPTKDNGMLAIVSAVATIGQNDRMASGLGDASAESVNRMMAPHLVRMAETRAKGRALRDLLNIGLVTVEELGPSGPAPSQGQQPEGIVVGGQRYTRDQVWAAFRQRMDQTRDAGLTIPRETFQLTNRSPLSALAGATQAMRKALAEAGKLPAGNGRSN